MTNPGSQAGLEPADVARVQQSFARVGHRSEALAERFYHLLFERHPELKGLFATVEMEEQRRKLLGAMTLAVNNLRNPERLHAAVASLGRRHTDAGVRPEYYQPFAATLVSAVAELDAGDWSTATEGAWNRAMLLISDVMKHSRA